jgi:hypothetical protein
MNAKALILIILLFCTPLYGAFATSKRNVPVDKCELTETKIVELGEPEFKTPIIMQSLYKLEGIKNIVDFDFSHKKEGTKQNFIVLGNFSQSDNPNQKYPFLTNMGQNGEIIWDVHENNQNKLEAIKLLKNKFGYVVLGNIVHPRKGRGFYLTQYDKNGKRLKHAPFYIPGYNAFAKNLSFTRDGKGYLVSIDRVSNEDKHEATIYRINIDGFSPWDRRYALEGDTVFENIQRLSNGTHLLTGSVEQEDGRVAAWLFNMREKGGASWQKTYLRGLNASLHQAIELKNGSFLLAGYTQSFYGDKKSAWIMKVGANTVPSWQRFYTGPYDFNIKDMHIDDNNLISVLLDAQPFLKKGESEAVKRKGHLRLLTLSPRGDLLYKDSFEGGDNAFATRLLKGESTEHIVMAMKQYLPPKEMEGVPPINEGWLFFVPSFADYVDPCVTG